MPLFHAELGMPKWFSKPTGTLKLNYGGHAKTEAYSDRYGGIRLPEQLDLAAGYLFELETEGRVPTKYGYRLPHDDLNDLVLIVRPDGFVKTVWLNRKSDSHRTLDHSRYVVPK